LSALPHALARHRERIERALEQCLPAADAEPTRLHQAMRYCVLDGGKRLRAALTYATGEALGVALTALDAPACAIELIHAYSLVHDDLPAMDNDDLRRGKPTCHRAYDQATAILAGDALQALAFERLAHDPTLAVGAVHRLEMIALLAAAAGSGGMAGGQAIDLAAVGKKPTIAELQDMHERKTGALIRAAVALGALACAELKADQREALDHYARALGLLFQITDDILDVEGETAALGKPHGSDQARGKPTYPALLGLDQAKRLAREWHDRALESLAPLGDNGDSLCQIAAFVLERRH
jgi:farnesyl diphosphate synthase